MPATPQISLLREHCSYLGAFCKSKVEPESGNINNATDVEDAKRSFSEGTTSTEVLSSSDFVELTSTTGLIRVIVQIALTLNHIALLIYPYHSLFSHLGRLI